MKFAKAVMAFSLPALMTSCNTGPQPLKPGVDNCYFCKMTISDVRFGAELVTRKGKIYKFDDSRCMVDFLKTKDVETKDINGMYLTNYSGTHQLINVNNALLLKAEELRSPMGGNVAAFDDRDSLQTIQKRFNGKTITWSSLYKP